MAGLRAAILEGARRMSSSVVAPRSATRLRTSSVRSVTRALSMRLSVACTARSAGVVAGVLDDAFAKAEREIQSTPCRIALFKPGDDAKCVQVVVETEAVLEQCGIEGFFAGVAEWGMTDVVRQGEGLSKLAIQ